MKQLLYLFLIVFLVGCEDEYEDIYRYSKIITQSKDYPVYLDMGEVGKIQVKAESPQESPFKIVSNDNYYFVGELLKGVHVYEKNGESLSYQCFIECKYIKDFEIAGNLFYCNNLVDLVILDVSEPLQATLLHREENYFNHFTSYKTGWNIPYEEGKGLIVGSERHELTGVVTEKDPNLDFGEYDKLYDSLTTKEIPDFWFTEQPVFDKPYIGMIQLGLEEIRSYGSYNSWAICAYRSGAFSSREEDLWTEPWGNYAPPYYYSNAYPVRMFFQDSLVFILGVETNGARGYSDCMVYDERYPVSYHLYFPTFRPIDITYLPGMQVFYVLSGQSIWGGYKSNESAYMERYVDYEIPTNATSIFRVENHLITLGNELAVYIPAEDELQLVTNYSDISGTCWSKDGNVLAVANAQGLFLYDISNLENIKLIP
ncbi:hypothetical protein [Draconibacterium sp.]|uniref:hypothetical protein n=1 Tax=Draconibacterium sp. TaxID=1965318 RepID=UPI0025D6880B|nr:hypothetical protein [uncultured Draconibacterium sp.]